MIAAARTVAVEVRRLDAMIGEVFSGRAVGLDGTGGRNMIGGYRVAQHRKHPRAVNIRNRRGSLPHAVEVRRLADVGRIRLPLVDVTGWELESLPTGVAWLTVAYSLRKPSRSTALFDGLGNFLLRGPDVPEIYGLAGPVPAERIGFEVVADAAGKRIGDDERRRH